MKAVLMRRMKVLIRRMKRWIAVQSSNEPRDSGDRSFI